MIWIDRLAILFGAIVWVIFFLLANGSGHPLSAFDTEVLKAVFLFTFLPWVLFRGLHWTFHRRTTPLERALADREDTAMRWDSVHERQRQYAEQQGFLFKSNRATLIDQPPVPQR